MQRSLDPSSQHHYHFVTGRIAEQAVLEVVKTLAAKHRFHYSVGVMPITVAALMTPKWLLRHLQVPDDATHLVIPGYLENGAELIEESLKIPVICGPKDCRDLPQVFGDAVSRQPPTNHDIEIIAEINHAPRMTISDVVVRAERLRIDGADVIDIGCDPAQRCLAIGDYIKALVDQGFRVSVDTFDPWEARQATACGASLVLSVNASNRDQAPDWGVEVVVIPDQEGGKKSFEKTVDFLTKHQVAVRLDPILDPIGTGFAESLGRYAETRREHPEAEMMMGIGNLTELTEVDSAGVNFLLLGFCQELGVRSVLTTEVINWARSSVRECAVARRLVHYSVNHRVPPKHLTNELVMLRDAKLRSFSKVALESLAETVKDNNYRLYAQDDQLHLISAGLHLSAEDPFELFDELLRRPQSNNVDPGHAFYLGFEMAKASIALLLGKQYEQDQALQWGFHTKPEQHHRVARTSRHRQRSTDEQKTQGKPSG